MKKIQKLIVITLALFTMNIAANALEIIDVKNSYWASQEIIRAIQNNYIGIVDGNKFNPRRYNDKKRIRKRAFKSCSKTR